jgi:XisI protein
MARLSEIVRDEVSWYAGNGRGAGIKLFRLLDDLNQTYAVTAVRDPNPQNEPTGVVVLARIVGDMVIIEEDRTDRPLVDSLMHAGIPREKIVLAYAGEPIPDPQP